MKPQLINAEQGCLEQWNSSSQWLEGFCPGFGWRKRLQNHCSFNSKTMFFFDACFLLIQIRNGVIVFLLNSVLCFNNSSIASEPPRTSIVSRPQRLHGPQKGRPNPPEVVSPQTLLTTTPNSKGGSKINPLERSGTHLHLLKSPAGSPSLNGSVPMPAIVLKWLPLVCQHKGSPRSII